MTIETDLLDGITGLLGRRNLTQVEMSDWAAGSATGGPDGDGLYPMTDSTGFTRKVPSPAKTALLQQTSAYITPQMFSGALDPSEAIQLAIDAAYDAGKDVFIPRLDEPYLIEADGPIQPGDGAWRRCLIRLRPGVSIHSNGAVLKYSEGRTNPPGLFGHWRSENAAITDVQLTGVTIDGGWRQLNPALPLEERYLFSNYAQAVDTHSGTPWDVTQLQHAFSILTGDNVRVSGCKFLNLLGYGASLGDNYLPTAPRGFGVSRAHVWESEFFNCYHGGVFLPTTWNGSSVHHNFFHGDGFYVAAIDLERHNALDEVTDCDVFANLFDFRDGYGPYGSDDLMLGYGRKILARHRRAVSVGYFQGGSTALGRGHRIHHNTVYQGQIDVFGMREVEVCDNRIETAYEDLTPAGDYPPYVDLIGPDAIKLGSSGDADDMSGCRLNGNVIRSDMDGFGIKAYGYERLEIIGGSIRGPRKGAIHRQYCGGDTIGVQILNVGIEAAPAPAIVIEGTKGPTRVISCTAVDDRVTVIPGPGPTDPPIAVTPHYGMRSFVKVVGAVPQYQPQAMANSIDGYTVAPFEGVAGSYTEWGNNIGGTGGFAVPGIQVGRGSGGASVNMVGGAGKTNFLQFWDGSFSEPRLFMGTPGDDKYGFVMLSFKAGGGADPTIVFDGETRQMLLNHLGGGLVTAGKWDAPLSFLGGGRSIWADADGRLRTKSGPAPTSDTDGARIILEGDDVALLSGGG